MRLFPDDTHARAHDMHLHLSALFSKPWSSAPSSALLHPLTLIIAHCVQNLSQWARTGYWGPIFLACVVSHRFLRGSPTESGAFDLRMQTSCRHLHDELCASV